MRGDLRPGRELQLVARHARARNRADHARFHTVLAERGQQRLADALGIEILALGRRSALQHARVGELVVRGDQRRVELVGVGLLRLGAVVVHGGHVAVVVRRGERRERGSDRERSGSKSGSAAGASGSKTSGKRSSASSGGGGPGALAPGAHGRREIGGQRHAAHGGRHAHDAVGRAARRAGAVAEQDVAPRRPRAEAGPRRSRRRRSRARQARRPRADRSVQAVAQIAAAVAQRVIVEAGRIRAATARQS